VDSNAIIFSAGDSFTLIVDDTGVLYGAGNNEDGQLGFSEPDEFYEPTALMDEWSQSLQIDTCSGRSF
jgi:alpha-tubulin suppressor-like RCC1 family protein